MLNYVLIYETFVKNLWRNLKKKMDVC